MITIIGLYSSLVARNYTLIMLIKRVCFLIAILFKIIFLEFKICKDFSCLEIGF